MMAHHTDIRKHNQGEFDKAVFNSSISQFTVFILMATALLILLLAPAPVSAQLYKWTDDQGNIRYSDHLPPEQRKKGHQRLSKDGHLLETKDAPTPAAVVKQQRAEKLAREEEARRKAEEEAKIQAEKDFNDNVLLMTFSDEKEIIRVEKERVGVIESVIRMLRQNIQYEQGKLRDLELQAKQTYLDNGEKIPGGMAQNIEYFGNKIKGFEHQLELKIEEKEKVKQQYAQDLVRYRELTQNKDGD